MIFKIRFTGKNGTYMLKEILFTEEVRKRNFDWVYNMIAVTEK